ncbi:MlaC/ttg2D family ABC transporter substrate-binding protein [Enhygromyxa salina]|uniref:MlaC/ttg2D family ABC transporter substrate-binding protein n=1 Tax=Enhygromyxa salina TaxID=215803 RepID=UPI0004E63D81|nr:ABC transporter substrate-binding protein [Enhygromyxa salina]
MTGLFGLGFVGALLAAPSVAQATETSAIDAFQAKHEVVVKLVKDKATDAQLQAKVDELLDYDYLSTSALGGPERFAAVCETRCDEFSELLTRLIRENYLRMIRKAEKHPVEYVEEVAGKNGVFKVTTRVKIEKNGREQTVTVEYVMHKVDGKWQVRDIITEGVSLAKTYRYEINKIAKDQGIGGVITKLQAKLDALAAED